MDFEFDFRYVRQQMIPWNFIRLINQNDGSPPVGQRGDLDQVALQVLAIRA
jgi:hypothetical protein